MAKTYLNIPVPTPTQNPVPSADIRDHVFGGAKIDEFVTSDSHTYTDRFGQKHRTIAGLNYDANQAMLKYGYITAKSFEQGYTLLTPNTVLQLESNGEYYRWDGDWSQPKVVPPGSTPESAGGVGQGKWVGVGDASLRADLKNPALGDAMMAVQQSLAGAAPRTQHDKNQETVSVLDFVAKADLAAITSGTMDATAAFTAAATASPGGVYVPAGTYLIPADIPGKFWGPGKRIQTVAEGTIPFTNMAQTHGNLILGYDAGKNFVGDDINARVVLLGPGAGRNVSTGTNITAAGHGTISGDTLVDALTDTSPCTGTELIAIGVNALKKAITLNNSIGIGRDALNENKFGSFNIGIGSSSFQQLHTGSNNVGVGRSTGMRAGIVTDSSGKRLSFNVVNGCTFIGNAAGREITSGDNNTYVGNNTGRGVTSTTNTFTGTATGANNVAVGADALNAVGTASNNVMLGRGAGRTLSSGNGNIFIGDQAGAGVASGDNKLVIANQGSLPFIEGLMNTPGDANNYARFDASVQPATDNVRACGSSSRRWSVIFAGTGTINTSDGTVKTDIREMEEVERRVAIKLKGMFRRFKFTDAVEEKGGRARLHFGVIAQDVQQAFADEGLNASDYGLFCYDEWEDQYQTIPAEMVYHPAVTSSLVSPDGEQLIIEEERWEVIKPAEQVLVKEAGGRYGIRYEELLCFIMAAI